MKYCFGIDIGGTTVKMGLFQEDGAAQPGVHRDFLPVFHKSHKGIRPPA